MATIWYTPRTAPKAWWKSARSARRMSHKGFHLPAVALVLAMLRIFGNMDDPNSEIRKYLEGKETITLGDRYKTHPNVYYVVSHEVTQVDPISQEQRKEG